MLGDVADLLDQLDRLLSRVDALDRIDDRNPEGARQTGADAGRFAFGPPDQKLALLTEAP